MPVKSAVFLLALAGFSIPACANRGPDSLQYAAAANAVHPPSISEEATSFLILVAEARLVNFQLGKLASERGTQLRLRDYGLRMLRDQPLLLEELKGLSTSYKVAIPMLPGTEGSETINTLQQQSGEAFDRAFITTLRSSLEQEVEAFHQATAFADKTVARFARLHLPLIESHLKGLQQIELEYQPATGTALRH